MRGTVLSWTLVRRAPVGVRTPFVLALVKTSAGKRFARFDAPPVLGAQVELSPGADDDVLHGRPG